tara:strand:- start:2711 stop:3562 length:852 start_codon:yes stop_codon:yes gene_type:complete
MKVGIIGAGYVGEATGRLMHSFGNEINFYDVVRKEFGKEFGFYNELDLLVKNSEIIFICVPTPQSEDGKIDLDILNSIADKLIKIYKLNNLNIPLVIKSTVVPGTTYNILKKFQKEGINLSIGNNPEFITEISKSWTQDDSMTRDWSSEDKIVIGSEDEKITSLLSELYDRFKDKIILTDTKTAELIKYASNYCLASKISFFNELFLISNKLGTDNAAVVKALSVDPRIGKYGSVNGKAYSGKCLPKDTKALQYFLKNIIESDMLDSTIKINDKMEKDYGRRE